MKITEKINIIPICIIMLFIISFVKFVVLAIVLLFVINQYDGKIFAQFNTASGKYSCGTNAPHMKLEPSAITFTIPLIASLFFTKFPTNDPIVSAVMQNINEFIINHRPFVVNITFEYSIMLIATYINHMKNTKNAFPNNNCEFIYLYDVLLIIFLLLIFCSLNSLITILDIYIHNTKNP